MKRVFPIALCLTVLACSPARQVVIEYEGSRLVYNCAEFEPQAKSAADARAIMGRTREAVGRAREEEDWVLFRSLRAARDLRDIKRLEELIFIDECSRIPITSPPDPRN